MTAHDRPEPDAGPMMGLRIKALREVRPADLAVRFAFGAAASVVASLCGAVFSPVVGGMFLAFPAILLASLTLLEQKEGTDRAVQDLRGAVLGAVGVIAFAFAGAALFDRAPTALVFAAVTTAWVLVAVGLYLGVAAWQRRRTGNRLRS